MRLNGATLLLLFCIVFALFSATTSTELQERTPQQNDVSLQEREYRHHKAREAAPVAGGEEHHRERKKHKKCRPKSRTHTRTRTRSRKPKVCRPKSSTLISRRR